MSNAPEIITEFQKLDFNPLEHLDSSKYLFAKPTAETKLLTNKKFILGVDEAGRGPVLGPMVYAASFCLEDFYEDFKKSGFVDSKAIDEKAREILFINLQDQEIRKYSGWLAHSLSPKEISEGMLKLNKYNLNSLAHDTTMGIIQKVLDAGYSISSVFIDTVGPPESYSKKLSSRFPSINFTVAKKADALYPIVSAASICAKVLRDVTIKNWVFPESEHLQKPISLTMGSGYPSDPTTAKWLKQSMDHVFGYPDIVRFSWSTCAKLLEDNAAKVMFNTPEELEESKSKSQSRPSYKRKASVPVSAPASHRTDSLAGIFSSQNSGAKATAAYKSSFLSKNSIAVWASL